MTITSSGALCDVCGKLILPVDPEERVHAFSVTGIKNMLHCDNACKLALEHAGGDWTLLPAGPLRCVFEAVYKEEKD